jgi:histidine phosphotransferase ChpT
MSLKNEEITTLMELLSSRICHDLVSPVGAINNGLEFMEDMADDPEGRQEATNLIAHSATAAGARLMTFRLAYGAGAVDGNIKPEDIQKSFGTLIRVDGKIRQSWDPFGPLGIKPSARGFCKTLMGALMLAQDSLPKGGMVFVDAGTGQETLIKAEGNGATVRDGVTDSLAGTIDFKQIDPRLVHPYILGQSARTYGFSIELKDSAEGSLTWSLKYYGTDT